MSAATAKSNPSATGRRKTAVARVTITEGTGNITINDRPFEDYLPTLTMQNAVLGPFQSVNLMNKFDVTVQAKGGGLHAQAHAIRLGVARALIQHEPELRGELKSHGHLTRDSRMKERKKAGQPGARKNYQFSKR